MKTSITFMFVTIPPRIGGRVGAHDHRRRSDRPDPQSPQARLAGNSRKPGPLDRSQGGHAGFPRSAWSCRRARWATMRRSRSRFSLRFVRLRSLGRARGIRPFPELAIRRLSRPGAPSALRTATLRRRRVSARNALSPGHARRSPRPTGEERAKSCNRQRRT